MVSVVSVVNVVSVVSVVTSKCSECSECSKCSLLQKNVVQFEKISYGCIYTHIRLQNHELISYLMYGYKLDLLASMLVPNHNMGVGLA